MLRLPRKTYRQSGGDQGTPGRTSDPLQSTKCCACHAKATGRAAETKGRQGVHPTPSAAPATQKLPAERRRPRDARAYIRPLAENQVPRLPRKTYQQSGGEQGTPGRTSDPLHSTSAAPATQNTGRAAETKGRQGVHPTPCRAPSAAPATQKLPAERRKPRYARAYIRPLAENQVPRLPRKSYRPREARAYIRPPTPCRAASAAPATQKLPAEWRRPRDARAYIRPLAEHQVLRLPSKSYRQSSGDQGTPGRTSDPLQGTKCCACHAKSYRQSGGDQGTPGRTSDPLQSTKCGACHAKKWVSECLNEWVNEWVSEWVSECEWASDVWFAVSVSEWVMWVIYSECEWVIWVWVSEWCEWVWVSEWCEWFTVSVSECEWVMWVCVSCEWVSECVRRRRTGGGEGEGGAADTELKTKNPHVNVGEKTLNHKTENKVIPVVITAQGGGGSFKNRKPIGEVRCCESGMAARSHCWTERWLRSPLFLSLSLTIYLPTYLSSMYLSIYRSIYLSIPLSFICLSV